MFNVRTLTRFCPVFDLIVVGVLGVGEPRTPLLASTGYGSIRWSLTVLLLVAILTIACTPGRPSNGGPDSTIQVGPVHRVTQVPYAYEPDIAVDPQNPDHLAAMAISPSTGDCDPFAHPGSCTIRLILDTSLDGGTTWQERPLTPSDRPTDLGGDPSLAFGSDSTLYQLGLSSAGIFVHTGPVEQPLVSADLHVVTEQRGTDKPWLTIVPPDDVLYVAYLGPTGGDHTGLLLSRSTDHGVTWSAPATVYRGPVIMAGGEQVALPPFAPQALVANSKDVAITWVDPTLPGINTAALGSEHHLLQVATSTDGGQTFSQPRTVADVWSLGTAIAHAGTYVVVFRRGQEQDQQVVMARSRDRGRTWQTSVVSGGQRLYNDRSPAPGLGIAPNGTLDVVYYAPQRPCLDPVSLGNARLQRIRWTDVCVYDVYSTFSKDGATTWAPPHRLNAQPIAGDQFVHIQGQSRPGEYIGMASTDRAAYPIWIDGTHASTVRIQR